MVRQWHLLFTKVHGKTCWLSFNTHLLCSRISPQCYHQLDESVYMDPTWTTVEDTGLYCLREDGLLCDVVLRCTQDGVEIPAHKAVLAAHSSYFKALLCGNWDTVNGKSTVDITLEHVTGDALLCWIRVRSCP